MYRFILLIAVNLLIMPVIAQTIIPLYKSKVPNSIETREPELKKEVEKGNFWHSNLTIPTLEIHLPEKAKATGTAVIIMPGGGYRSLSYIREGIDVAKVFTKMGVSAFILKSRLPSDQIMIDKTIGPLQDAQQAIKIVRMRAKEWGIDTEKIGVIGFSAGGHLASTAGTHFSKAVINNNEQTSLRPNFMILIYPVISFTEDLVHKGSRNNLIGINPTLEQINLYSNEMQVTGNTPPTILIHAGDDTVVKVENSLRFYEALLKNGVSAEMHIYPKGSHGFGLTNKTTPDNWMDRVENWLKAENFIKN